MTPTGSGSPQMSPTSRPTLTGLLTPTPTSSNSGCLTISAITILPTKPVPHTTTRLAMCHLRIDEPRFTLGAAAVGLCPKPESHPLDQSIAQRQRVHQHRGDVR